MMTDAELEAAFIDERTLLIYTSSIGHFVEGRIFALHWPAKRDAFLLQAVEPTSSSNDFGGVYWVQRSDPSLILKPA